MFGLPQVALRLFKDLSRSAFNQEKAECYRFGQGSRLPRNAVLGNFRYVRITGNFR